MKIIIKKYICILSIGIFILTGCGSSSDSKKKLDVYSNSSCGDGKYLRIKTAECLPLQNPDWGFQGFDIPQENVYTLQNFTQEDLQSLIDSVPPEGGKIIIPECTIETNEGIDLKDNIILEGAGIGKTIISNRGSSAVKLKGENIIVRNFTVKGNKESLNGIDGWYSKGNILVEFIEAKNFKADQGSGIYFTTVSPLENSQITIRYNITSNSLHGIAGKTHTSAKMLIYSNKSFANYNYGIDMSTTSDIEIAGNYLYENVVAGAKTPMGDNIIYHHNDINYNGTPQSIHGKAGIVYMGERESASIIIENNNLSNNGGNAFATWSAKFKHLTLRDNIVTNSLQYGCNILIYNVQNVDVYSDHGKICGDSNITEHF